MGSATTQALAASVKALDAHTLDLATARDLFAAARAVSESTQLAGALSDSAAPVAAREQVVKAVFGSALGAAAVDILTTVAAQRWSDAAGLADGIEELYDHAYDPSEIHNVATDPAYAAVLAELRRRTQVLVTCRSGAQCSQNFGPVPEPDVEPDPTAPPGTTTSSAG